MPCSDGGPSREQIEEQRNLPAVLCAIMSALERSGAVSAYFDAVDWQEAGVSRRWVEFWWEEHKQQDAERRAREERMAREQAVRRAVIAKLTPEERDALGFGALP